MKKLEHWSYNDILKVRNYKLENEYFRRKTWEVSSFMKILNTK